MSMDNHDVEDDGMMLELTTQVVSAYVGNNPIAASDLSGLI